MNKKVLSILAAGALACGVAACVTSCDLFPSEGLEMKLSNDGTHYTVVGSGTCKDENVVIPSEYEGKPVTAIADRTFMNGKIKEVSIPDSVETVGKFAFYDCKDLDKVRFGKGVKRIETSAFYGCESMKSITLPNRLEALGACAFSDCEELIKVRLPDSAKLEEGVFSGCSDLTEFEVGASNENYRLIDGNLYSKDGKILVQYLASNTQTEFTVPEAVEEIAGYAFYDAENLQTVRMGDNVTKCGERAFEDCKKMTEITLSKKLCEIESATFIDCERLQSVVIPDSVEGIGFRAFGGCKSMESITIGTGLVRSMGEPFSDCDSLNAVHITDLNAWCKIEFYQGYDNPLYYAGNLYLNGELVTDLVFGEDVKEISAYAFVNYLHLKSVRLASDTAFNGAFSGCENLKSIVYDLYRGGHFSDYFPAYLYENIKHVGFTESEHDVTIPYGCFWGNGNLQSVEFPVSLVRVEENAFAKSADDRVTLERVFYRGDAEGWSKVVIENNNERLEEATVYFYSETQPEASGNYWRYVDGVPTVW